MNALYLPEILSCGYFNCFEEFGNLKKSPERVAKGIEIELFLEDGYATFIDGKEHPIRKNHIIVAKTGSKRYSLLPFKTVFLKIAAGGELERILNGLPDCFFAVHSEKIKELFSDIILLNEEVLQNPLKIGAKILTLTDYLVADAEHSDQDSGQAYPLMHRAKKVIEEQYAKKLTTAMIAETINLSESRFRFLFGKTYGISPRRYLTDVRIANAKQLLWENHTMTEIAERCGFGCQQYFNEIFKKEVGMTPMKYRNDSMKRYYD